MQAKPFLKWPGGKTQLLPKILARLPERIETYYEPFLGGGAVFFALANERRFKHAVISDTNAELIETYRVVQRTPMELIRYLRDMPSGEAAYYQIRDSRPFASLAIAARFIYLNKRGFNGLYRVNRAGDFNVPYGKRDGPLYDEAVILAACEALQEVDIHLHGFDRFRPNRFRAGGTGGGDAVYFDPPYLPVSATSSFAAYTKDGFGEDEHWALRNLYGELIGGGVTAVLSNADTPLAREMYQNFKYEIVPARRNINVKGDKRGPVGELLVYGA